MDLKSREGYNTWIWNQEKDKDRENKMVVDKVSVIWVNVEGLDV